MSYKFTGREIIIEDRDSGGVRVGERDYFDEGLDGFVKWRGGLTMDQIKDSLGGEYPMRMDSFEDEVSGLVLRGVLEKRSPNFLTIYGIPSEEPVLIGNIFKGELYGYRGLPIKEWLKVERRPDVVIEVLARQGKFTSLLVR